MMYRISPVNFSRVVNEKLVKIPFNVIWLHWIVKETFSSSESWSYRIALFLH